MCEKQVDIKWIRFRVPRNTQFETAFYMIFILQIMNLFQQFRKFQQINMNIDTIFDWNYKNPHTAFEAIDFYFLYQNVPNSVAFPKAGKSKSRQCTINCVNV